MSRHSPGSDAPRFDVVSAVDDLRQLVARADAIASAAEDLFDRLIWDCDGSDDADTGDNGEGYGDDDGDRPLERLAHLMGATAEAVRAAARAGDQIAATLLRHGEGSS
jgi:hypothetical protein